MQFVRHARTFRTQKQGIEGAERGARKGGIAATGQQHDTTVAIGLRRQETFHVYVPLNRSGNAIVHRRAAQLPIRRRKAAWQDDVERNGKTGGQANDRAHVPGDVRLIESDPHDVAHNGRLPLCHCTVKMLLAICHRGRYHAPVSVKGGGCEPCTAGVKPLEKGG